ncbi:MAG: TRAP transporter substrate-binding protein [Pelagibacteraceae bacterium]|jgi:TRAP-type mannitol/chloroaromatic compound transport system substrate-binding protein
MSKKKKDLKGIKAPSRRSFFKAAAATGAAAAASVAMPNIAFGAPVTLKMQAAWPSGGDIFFEMATDYANMVNTMSGGDLKIEVLPVGAVLKTAEIADGVSKGVVDASHSVTAYWYGKNPAASLFGTGPSYGFSSQELMGWIEYGGGRALYEKTLSTIGLDVVGFFAMPMPAQPFGWFKKNVTKVSDVKGMKYRTVGLATNVLTEMGMVVRQLPGGEIQPAMKTGLIDAAEFNNPTSDKNFGMQDVSKHYHLGSFHQSQEMFEMHFNKKTFNNLSPAHQAIIKNASYAANTDNYFKALVRYSTDLGKLMNESGVNVYQTSDEILNEQLKAWDKVMADFRKDALFDEIVKSQQAYAKKVMKYLFMNQPNYRLAYTNTFGDPAKVKI